MNPLELIRASPVRYALLFALSSALLMGVLLGVIYWQMSTLLARHLDQGIEAQLQVLQSDLEQDGRKSMLGLVRQHEKLYKGQSSSFSRTRRLWNDTRWRSTCNAGWRRLARYSLDGHRT